MLLDFRTKTFTTGTEDPTPITFARSGHPCLSLLAYEEDGDMKEIYQMDQLEDQDLEENRDSDLEKLLARTSANVEHLSAREGGGEEHPGMHDRGEEASQAEANRH